jgi:FkbM family methyltransferase
MKNFSFDYCRRLAEAIGADFDDNYDSDRFGPENKERRGAKAMLRRVLSGFGMTSRGAARRTITSGLALVEPHLADLEWLHLKLDDDESRQWLADLMAYRALGHRKVKLASNTSEYWAGIRRAKQLGKGADSVDLGFLGFRASRIDLGSLGIPLKLYFVPFAAHVQFVMQPYRCVANTGTIEVLPGDYVLDCGGCYGDTALYFSHKVGSKGKVLSFEFVPSNLELWRRNVEMNPHLMSAIQLVPSPVSERSGEKLFIEGSGPGTRVVVQAQTPDALCVETVAIDDVVNGESLPRVDFIKMDIEGSELSALRGAEKTLRTFRPKLAISIYHKLPDFWEIARYLDSLDLGYRFYIRHFTIHAEETVLFAVASE